MEGISDKTQSGKNNQKKTHKKGITIKGLGRGILLFVITEDRGRRTGDVSLRISAPNGDLPSG